MKKIITAAAVAAMAAGSVFATEAKITLNYRTKLDAFAQSTVKTKGSDDVITKEWMDWEGYDGAGKQAAANSSDTFKFVLDGDNAGATLALNMNTNASSYTLNQYSAWMKWAVGNGTLKLESGNWKDGYADGAYRVKKDVDAQNAEGVDFEKFKLGSIFADNQISFVDNLGGSNKALSSFAEYSMPVNDDINLSVLLGGIYNNFDKIEDDDTTTYYDSYLVSRVKLGYADLFDAEFIYKKPAKHDNVFGLYVMPKVLDGLTLNIGGAFDLYDKDGSDYKDWGFDLRARYQASSALSVSFFTNVSGTDLDAGRKIAGGIVGRKGAYGYAKDGTTAVANSKFKTAMWNNLSARYKINDLITATMNVGLITPLSKIDDDDTSYGPEWRVTPAVQVYAASNASIWAGVALSGVSVESGDFSVFSVEVPVVFRVKM